MCSLCSHDETEVLNEQKRLYAEASRLRRLARKIDLMADGKIDPHDCDQVLSIAKNSIRFLVSEYV